MQFHSCFSDCAERLIFVLYLMTGEILFAVFVVAGYWMASIQREREEDGHRKKKSTLLLFFSKDALRS